MPSISRIDSLASRVLQPNIRRQYEDEDDDEDAIFAELEAEIENSDSAAVREHGMSVLKREMEHVKDMKVGHHGEYTEITDEKEVIRVSAREHKCVVHFYHSDFKRCEVMDKHLAKLAAKYFETRFFRVFVENVPWLVEKLQIKVLPCVVCFIDGVSKDRLIGFEDLGNVDNFETTVLELRLLMTGVIQKSPKTSIESGYRVSSFRQGEKNEDDDVFDL
ncbi:GTPase inhibitor [Cyathus striatus]|nr:GTPase inhibitor [Cyathus striatus]